MKKYSESISGKGGSMLRLEDVNTYYGYSHILQGVSLEVKEGEIVAVNGARRTASIKLKDGKTMDIPWEEVVEKDENGK